MKKNVVRKYFASLIVAGCAFVASPLAAAPQLGDTEAATPTVAVQHVRVPAGGGLRDELAMVLVGTALIGLASAVRRAA